MNLQLLKDTIQQLFANGKGLLAMDESLGTCNKRFAAAGIPQTIKVDMGAKAMAGFPNEKITEGLDGLRERLAEYKQMGARFAKWRGVITIGANTPTIASIKANVHALSRYAALCQEAGIVPIVEPEVLMNGDHSIEQCYDVTEKTLKALFYELYKFKIDLEGIILKPNMIIAGTESTIKNSIDEVAAATVSCLLSSVPASVPAIAFLSGGQSPQDAAAHLNAISKNYKHHLPWIVSFSFARAIQQPALDIWKAEDANVAQAQRLLYTRAKIDKAARAGEYVASME